MRFSKEKHEPTLDLGALELDGNLSRIYHLDRVRQRPEVWTLFIHIDIPALIRTRP